MIDKEKFNELFHLFDNDGIVMLIDSITEQRVELIGLLDKNMAESNLVQIKFWAHKTKSGVSSFHNPETTADANNLEEAAKAWIIEILDSPSIVFPESFQKIRREKEITDLCLKMYASGSIIKYIKDNSQDFSPVDEKKLEGLEKQKVSELLPELLEKLKVSYMDLINELSDMKRDLYS